MRNWLSISRNVSFSLGIWTVISYYNILRDSIIKSLIIVTSMIILYIIVLYLINKTKETKSKSLLRSRYKSFFRVSQFLFAVDFCIIVCFIYFDIAPFSYKNRMDNYNIVYSEETIDKNMDILVSLNENNWDNMGIDERQGVLQKIVDIERCDLGIPFEIDLIVKQFNSSRVIGKYSHRDKQIIVNKSMLMQLPSWRMIENACHESYHAYQRCLVDAYADAAENYKKLRIFDGIEIYKDEFSNYIDGEDNFEGYYGQRLEEDARSYGEEAMLKYKLRIKEYLKEQ